MKWKVPILTIIAISAIIIAGTVLYPRFNSEPVTSASTPIVELNADTIFNLVNQERINAGLQPLVRDSRLDESAQLKADDMTANNYFDHVNPSTGVRGYTLIPSGMCSYQAENISYKHANDTNVVMGWYYSETHREAMLDGQYDSTGVAVSGRYVVQHFCNIK